MSHDLVKLAISADTSKATDKLVLVVLADFANDDDLCAYPSVETLSNISSLNQKTVRSALKRLIFGKFIFDTGRRVGDKRQVKVYQINPKLPQNGYRHKSKLPKNFVKATQNMPLKLPKTGEQNQLGINKEPKDLLDNKGKTKTYMPDGFLESTFRRLNS